MNRPIDPVELFHDFQREPFEPRRVRLLDGGIIDIPLREKVVIGVDYLDVGIQAENESPGICSTLVTVPLAGIQEIELIRAPHAPK